MMARRVLATILLLPMATFFAFVGWHKSVDSLADLARYHAWTVHLPEWAGRLVGWSELACAAALVMGLRSPRIGRIAALVLIANQVVASGFHAAAGELSALPQNLVLIAMALGVALFLPPSPTGEKQ
jgi:uncharacterized membrane protein YphA (DoxX/SURF4 family)